MLKMAEIDVLQNEVKNMKEQNNKEHKALFKIVEKVGEQMTTFIKSANNEYATKDELKELKTSIKNTDIQKQKKSIEWLKTWWAVLVALIWAGWMLASKIL